MKGAAVTAIRIITMGLNLRKIVLISDHSSVSDDLFKWEMALVHGEESNAQNEILRFDSFKKRIGSCTHCDGCFLHEEPCAFRDDFNELAKLLLEGDSLVVFASKEHSRALRNLFSRAYVFHKPYKKHPHLKTAIFFYYGDSSSFLEIKPAWIKFCVALGIKTYSERIISSIDEEALDSASKIGYKL